MLTFAFWNLNRNEFIGQLLCDLVVLNRVDVLVLAECALDIHQFCDQLSSSASCTYRIRAGRVNRRVMVLTREPITCGGSIAESAYMTVWPLIIPNAVELLLGGIHAISKLEADQLDLDMEAVGSAQIVREAENRRGHRRTIVLGDFNMNPFDPGMAMAGGFHAVMARDIAARIQRRVKFHQYPMFYNPMWSKLGDRPDGAPGTYYYDKAAHLVYYWYMHDQVLLRPELLGSFTPADVRILDRIEPTSLLSRGVPNAQTASDHLPLLLRLEP